MTSAAEHRRPLPSDSEAILNALPNPVLLVAPDGRIVDANIAAESFFEISTQFLRRQYGDGSPHMPLVIDDLQRAAAQDRRDLIDPRPQLHQRNQQDRQIDRGKDDQEP